jgi:hypothetical protein
MREQLRVETQQAELHGVTVAAATHCAEPKAAGGGDVLDDLIRRFRVVDLTSTKWLS